MRIRPSSGIAVSLPLVVAVLSACVPTPNASRDTTAGGTEASPSRTGPKSIAVINSGVAPGLDNHFVVTSNNAAGIVLGLYAGKLIQSDNPGNRMSRLVEAVPTLDNGLWKLNPDGTTETRSRLVPNARWHDGTPVSVKDLLSACRDRRESTARCLLS